MLFGGRLFVLSFICIESCPNKILIKCNPFFNSKTQFFNLQPVCHNKYLFQIELGIKIFITDPILLCFKYTNICCISILYFQSCFHGHNHVSVTMATIIFSRLSSYHFFSGMQLYKKVEKHLCEEENLLQVIINDFIL
jgi:hypothetical protein